MSVEPRKPFDELIINLNKNIKQNIGKGIKLKGQFYYRSGKVTNGIVILCKFNEEQVQIDIFNKYTLPPQEKIIYAIRPIDNKTDVGLLFEIVYYCILERLKEFDKYYSNYVNFKNKLK
ncbi:MAG: hypothetical protein H0X03_09605, partial [Nitrosopumilus sp.]|nr:hypothetical protein [Nitrosopumilus sp.]